ncbi:hypothetical protein LTR37_016136 [Vermiconidia calcicola]|uniref:Uncharacterized protein n=1 Tax=Vermiconidia calcicola TaxID=1690605 RepID=A0ACC3MNR6_9PEZI|nr:hypothetical protein LTR37_016136 [Vermiconidia calcicola]
MARASRRLQAFALVLLLAPLLAPAQQLSNLPDLSTAAQAGETSATLETTAEETTTAARTTPDAQSTTEANNEVTDAPDLSTDSSSASPIASRPLATAPTLTDDPVLLSDIPTLAGVGIPQLEIPYTGGAPFMQKSNLPEGTFFIAAGAVLAFLGACVLLWRGMVAWSINRSVKRTAMLASMGGSSEKPGRTTSSYWGGTSNGGYNRVATGGRNSVYKDIGAASSMSLDNLTSAGKPVKSPFRDSVAERPSSGAQPPANLFFSPTARAASRGESAHRNSGYMPSGYYASPSAQAAGGQTNVNIGGNLAPGYGNNRHSAISNPSPPSSPGLPPQSRGSTAAYRQSVASRDGLRAPSRDGLTSNRNSYLAPGSRDGLTSNRNSSRAPSRDGLTSNRNSYLAPGSRDGLTSNRNSTNYLGANPSSSSLMVGHQSTSDLSESRAPSAYLEDLFQNHGRGPRERFS